MINYAQNLTHIPAPSTARESEDKGDNNEVSQEKNDQISSQNLNETQRNEFCPKPCINRAQNSQTKLGESYQKPDITEALEDPPIDPV